MLAQSLAFAALTATVHAWLPAGRGLQPDLFSNANNKIRGVNLGAWAVAEPWMIGNEWGGSMNCQQFNKNTANGNQGSEFDCVSGLGQSQANTAFSNHRKSFITQNDIKTMVSYGLNTIRIPLGYWLFPSLLSAGDKFPQGVMDDLINVCGWASSAGMYIIIDAHAVPGAQQALQPSTGQLNPNADFYSNTGYYEKMYSFFEQMLDAKHNSTAFRNVGMFELVNEPVSENSGTDNMRQVYYPTAINRIRAKENSLGVATADRVHISMMDYKWGSGEPKTYLPSDSALIYQDHNYEQYAAPLNQPGIDDYRKYACHDDRVSNNDSPLYVGEFSLAISTAVQNNPNFAINSGNNPYYQKWFIAQLQQYEKTLGWIFWSWKTTGLNDPRWDYQLGVSNGLIPTNINSAISQNVCAGF